MFNRMVQKVKSEVNKEHQGAIAFEYVILLVIMAVAIFTAWDVLADQVALKAKDIAVYIQNNGKQPMGTTGTNKNPQWNNSGGR